MSYLPCRNCQARRFLIRNLCEGCAPGLHGKHQADLAAYQLHGGRLPGRHGQGPACRLRWLRPLVCGTRDGDRMMDGDLLPKTEACVVRFVGGPLDGQERAYQKRPTAVKVPVFHGYRAIGEPPVYSTGQYEPAGHTRFGDPWRYEWKAMAQRCLHQSVLEVREHGQPSRWFCYDCDAILDTDPRIP